ncbi:MAG: exodeoxyribonuclease VII small subunit [Alphaproteobacteria bacterium]
MSDVELPDDIKAMSFEQALEELRGIVDGLERGDGSLDQSIKAYERGSLLRMHCDAKLREAQMKIEQIRVKADGSADTEAFDA